MYKVEVFRDGVLAFEYLVPEMKEVSELVSIYGSFDDILKENHEVRITFGKDIEDIEY